MDFGLKTSRFICRHPYAILAAAVAVVLTGWEILARTGVLSEYSWSYPTRIVGALWHDLLHPIAQQGDQNSRRALLPHLGFTLMRFVAGFTAASLIGVSAGFLLSVSRSFQALGHPVVNVLRSLPSAAVWPICAAIIGYSIKSQMFVVIFGTTWPILIYTMKGVGALPREIHDSLHFMWLEWYRRWWVLFLWSLPSIVTGLEVGCAISFLLTVTVEVFYPSFGGLGWYLFYFSNNGIEADRLLAGVFLIGAIGWASNTGVHLLRRRLIFWESDLRQIIRQTAPHCKARVVDQVRDPRRREILCTDYVTGAIEKGYGIQVRPAVLYQGYPYMFPPELTSVLHVKPFSEGIVQRDITISVPQGKSDRGKVALFARSWIVKAALTPRTHAELDAGRMTIGQIVREHEQECEYRHLWYKERISDRLGSIFGAGGTVHVIQRGRVIVIRNRAAIFIEEFVPV